VGGGELRFNFKGKSGKTWRLQVKDRRIARVVKACQELPGQHLFQYVDADSESQAVTSSDVNNYLREITGTDITAKDFRTWAGTVLAERGTRTDLAPAFRDRTLISAFPLRPNFPPRPEIRCCAPGFYCTQRHNITGWITFETSKIGIGALHGFFPKSRALDAFLQSFDAPRILRATRAMQKAMRRFGSERVPRCHSTRYGFAA
jgi:hypothetical protein